MDDDQERFLREASAIVKQEAFHMQRFLDEGNLEEALKHASSMISELKTSTLSPKTYYELYMQVFDNLSQLKGAFMDEYRRGKKMEELYQMVQCNANILPRLYLLITVGAVYIESRQAPAKTILKDLIEMTKGLQHPVRGLFLRYYLNKMCKDKLPDAASEYQEDGGDVTDSLDFLLQNLSEMNRLWIRMQHAGNVRDKNKREKERSDLRVTVGENIVRLSSLEGVTISLYKTVVLPRVLEVITSNKDAISQQYLMDCIVQAFPDEYHLQSLEPLLEASTQLQPTVEVKTIFINLLNKLSDYAEESELEIVREIDIFSLIKNYIDKVLAEGSAADTKKLLQLEVAFLRLSLKAYPLSTGNVNQILGSCVDIIERHHSDKRLDADSLRSLVKLLSYPLETLSLAILTMNNYPRLMEYLQFSARKQVATKIVEAVVTSKKELDNSDTIQQLIQFISPLLTDPSEDDDTEEYEFIDEQQSVAKLVHLVTSSDPSTYFNLLNIVREEFRKGGQERMRYSYPTLVFCYIKLLVYAAKNDGENLLSAVIEVLTDLTDALASLDAELAINLKLQCLLALNSVVSSSSDHEEAAFRFGTEAVEIYKEELYNSDSKFAAIQSITSTLAMVNCLTEDHYDELSVACTKCSFRQLKRADQAQAVSHCAHMFWTQSVRHEERAVQCMEKGAYLANICKSRNPALLVMSLNQFVHFAVVGIDVDANIVTQLVERCQAAVERSNKPAAKAYLRNSLAYIQSKQGEGKLRSVQLD